MRAAARRAGGRGNQGPADARPLRRAGEKRGNVAQGPPAVAAARVPRWLQVLAGGVIPSWLAPAAVTPLHALVLPVPRMAMTSGGSGGPGAPAGLHGSCRGMACAAGPWCSTLPSRPLGYLWLNRVLYD